MPDPRDNGAARRARAATANPGADGATAARPDGHDGVGATEIPVNSTALIPRPSGGEICFVRFAPKPPYDHKLVLWDDPHSASAASYRLLRQRLIERGNPRVILCTSASPQEGKTTLASNLGLAFAEIGRHSVLLIEADFRSDALSQLFGFGPTKGLKFQLTRHKKNPVSPWVVIQVGADPLYAMVTGTDDGCPQCGNALPGEARFCPSCGNDAAEGGAGLDSGAFLAAVDRFRQAFDYVIIDAPSVLTGGEVNLIQDAADAVVFAARRGQSSEQDLRRAVEQVAPAQVAGVVLFEK